MRRDLVTSLSKGLSLSNLILSLSKDAFEALCLAAFLAGVALCALHGV